jgi:hypothetical protein
MPLLSLKLIQFHIGFDHEAAHKHLFGWLKPFNGILFAGKHPQQ